MYYRRIFPQQRMPRPDALPLFADVRLKHLLDVIPDDRTAIYHKRDVLDRDTLDVTIDNRVVMTYHNDSCNLHIDTSFADKHKMVEIAMKFQCVPLEVVNGRIRMVQN